MEFQLTNKAERFIRLMINADGVPGSGFRLTVRPGGCSGLSAEMAVQASPDAGDLVFEQNGTKLFVPEESRRLLEGVTIDFQDTAVQTGLVFHDPKGSTCQSNPKALS